MFGSYVGGLDHNDPLYSYLREHILPQMGAHVERPSFRVFQSSCSRNVCLYLEKHSRTRVVAKFYPPKPFDAHPRTGEAEYTNLVHLRGLGFDHAPHYVVRPLGFNAGINNVVLTEYLEGEHLDTVINGAVHLGRRDRLQRKLSALAWFLASLHNRTAGDWGVNFDYAHAYMTRLIGSLVGKRGMGPEHAGELYHLRDAWRARGAMWEDRAVLVHGDATPSNFLYGRDGAVLAIDLERMQWADRVFDLGRLCGELCHFFYRGQGDPAAAEPFIGHLIWEYCRHFPHQMDAFRSVCRRVPFYMGITLLRIARNSWIDWEYRWRLVEKAKQILRATP